MRYRQFSEEHFDPLNEPAHHRGSQFGGLGGNMNDKSRVNQQTREESNGACHLERRLSELFPVRRPPGSVDVQPKRARGQPRRQSQPHQAVAPFAFPHIGAQVFP